MKSFKFLGKSSDSYGDALLSDFLVCPKVFQEFFEEKQIEQINNSEFLRLKMSKFDDGFQAFQFDFETADWKPVDVPKAQRNRFPNKSAYNSDGLHWKLTQIVWRRLSAGEFRGKFSREFSREFNGVFSPPSASDRITCMLPVCFSHNFHCYTVTCKLQSENLSKFLTGCFVLQFAVIWQVRSTTFDLNRLISIAAISLRFTSSVHRLCLQDQQL